MRTTREKDQLSAALSASMVPSSPSDDGRDELLRLLHQFSVAVVEAPDVRGVCTRAFDTIERLLRWHSGVIYLRSEHEAQLILIDSRNLSEPVVERLRRLPLDETTQSGSAVVRGEVLLTAGTDYRYPRLVALVREKSLGGVVTIPLVAHDEIVGVMTIFTDRDPERDVPGWLRPSLGILSRLLGLALANARLFDRVREANHDIQRANQELEAFTFALSNDLTEPLKTLQAFCKTLDQDFGEALEKDGREIVASIAGSAERMRSLIDDLKRVVDAGRRRGPSVEIDMKTLAERVLRLDAERLDARGVRASVLSPMPTAVGDVTLVETLVANLVANAVIFNDSVPPRVDIGFAPDVRPPAFRRIRAGRPPLHTYFVRDNGVGIPEEHHEAIFALFRRLDPARPTPGVGAGLAIARRIAKAHGGQIWVESDGEHGATFYFTLPATE